jgi:hypothetical protein
MRIQRFKNLGAAMNASREDLVSEFLDASTAEDHEFSREIDRQRYCRFIHSVGCLSYGQKFMEDLEAVYFSLDPFVAETANRIQTLNQALTRA